MINVMNTQWSFWLPAAMAGELDTKMILPLLGSLTPDKLTHVDVMALWQWLFNQLPPIPGLGDVFPCRLDTCGTGGSGLCHFNTSTTVALVLSSMGIPVTKFGNRAATSQSGSFDFLGALGLGQPLPLDHIVPALTACNLALVYAPQCLPGLAHLAAARKQLGQKTVFNLLGPLLNPCRPTHQLLGASQHYPWMQAVLASQNVTGWIVTGHAGQDDVTPWGQTHVVSVNNGAPFLLEGTQPIPTQPWPDDVASNVAAFWAIVQGQDVASPAYHLVCHNAAAALCMWQEVTPTRTLAPDSIQRVQAQLASGQVARHVQHVQRVYATVTA
jgi:anthranilate phosphoribosyltransferase